MRSAAGSTSRASRVGRSAELAAGISRSARLHVVTGKGGTGKTTVAAALAMALAENGRRVLLVEVEGRQALAQLFDVAALPYADQHLAAAAGGGEVLGLSVDPEEALLEYLDLFYNLKRAARVMKRMGAIDFVTTLAPGLRDVLLTGKLKERANLRGPDGAVVYDSVVLDAPPTGRILQFLDATSQVAHLAKVGPINRQSNGVIDLLHSTNTAVHIVTLLEEMPVQETIDATTELVAAGFRLGAIIVNRERPTLVQEGQLAAGPTGLAMDAATIARGLRGTGVDTAYAEPLATQMAQYGARQEVQVINAERLRVISAPVIRLPELNPPVGVGELHELAGCFITQPDE
jgi:anion-transporting  ArsA/GET3 family ATPase